MTTRRTGLLAVASLTLLSLAPALSAQESDTLLKTPLKIVVGFPPGGSADVLARVLAQYVKGVAPAVIVENKPGAGGRMALEQLKHSTPDGSTIVVTPASMLTVFPHIYKTLSYQPVSDFAPITRIAAAPYILAIGPMVPANVKTVQDFVAWSKANPALVAYGSSGAGSVPHFTGVALGKAFGMPWMHVPYKGASPAMTDLVGGQVAANVSVSINALPHIQSGKLRALAVSAPQRMTELPDVPTFAEVGAPQAATVEWFGVFAPAKTSPEVIQRLNQAIGTATQTPEFQAALRKGSYVPLPPESPEATAAVVQQDLAHWAKQVKASGFTPED